MNPIYILAAILIFGILVAVHEFGHFAAAKLCGVRVNEFAIGMGPVIWRKQKGETQYSFRALPVGGFCAMEGEDEDTGEARSFVRQGFWKKLLILVAGSGMNFLTGLVIIFCIYLGAGAFLTDQITGFAPGFPLEGETGLMEGDIFYKIDGYRTYLRGDASMFLSYHTGDTIDIEVIRDGERIVLNDLPMQRREYTSTDGSAYTGFGLYVGTHMEEATLLSRLKYTWNTGLNFVQLVWFSLEQLFAGGASVEDLSGPVGIVSTMTEIGSTSETTSQALESIFYFGALLAVNLSVMNMLPIPALDGGRVFFLVVDAVCMLLFKKTIPEKYQSVVNGAGFAVLMAFMLLVTLNDVSKLFR